jgi:hypothetical protein
VKKIVILFITLLILSCKEKGQIQPESIPNDLTIEPSMDHQNHHYHYYKVYEGKIKLPSKYKRTDTIRNFVFDGDTVDYLANDFILENNKKVRVYKIKKLFKKIITPINSKIERYHKPRISNSLTNEKILGKGDYGCIPKFTADASGNLLVFSDGSQKYLLLNIALHSQMNMADSTVAYLRNERFNISENDYTRLRDSFRLNNFLQGGISNPRSDNKMKILDENDNELFIVDNNPNN